MRGDSCQPRTRGAAEAVNPLPKPLPPHQRAWLVPWDRDTQRVAVSCSTVACPGCQAAAGPRLHPQGWWDGGICSTAGHSWTTPGQACAPARPGQGQERGLQLLCSKPGAVGSFWTLV